MESVKGVGELEGFWLGFGDVWAFGLPVGQSGTFNGIGVFATTDFLVGPLETISTDFPVGSSDGAIDGIPRGCTRLVGNLEGASVEGWKGRKIHDDEKVKELMRRKWQLCHRRCRNIGGNEGILMCYNSIYYDRKSFHRTIVFNGILNQHEGWRSRV